MGPGCQTSMCTAEKVTGKMDTEDRALVKHERNVPVLQGGQDTPPRCIWEGHCLTVTADTSDMIYS